MAGPDANFDITGHFDISDLEITRVCCSNLDDDRWTGLNLFDISHTMVE